MSLSICSSQSRKNLENEAQCASAICLAEARTNAPRDSKSNDKLPFSDHFIHINIHFAIFAGLALS